MDFKDLKKLKEARKVLESLPAYKGFNAHSHLDSIINEYEPVLKENLLKSIEKANEIVFNAMNEYYNKSNRAYALSQKVNMNELDKWSNTSIKEFIELMNKEIKSRYNSN